jgi:hypothetical protein
MPVTGVTRTFMTPTLQDKAAVLNEPQSTPRRSHYSNRRQWSLRAAIPLWIGLAVAGWAAVVISVYSFVRHENEVAVIEKIDPADRQLVREQTTQPTPAMAREELNRLDAVTPAAGGATATPAPAPAPRP